MLVALLAPASSWATLPGSNGDLVFTSGSGIFVKDPSKPATPAQNIAPGVTATDPRFSPDGTRIAFGMRVSGGDAIAVMNADGSGLAVLTAPGQGEYDSSPAWSPDGEQLAFYRMRQLPSNRIHELRVVDVADGGNGTVALSRSGSANAVLRFVNLEWSPDPENSRIALEMTVAKFGSNGAVSGYHDQLHLASTNGTTQLVREGERLQVSEYPGGRRLSWSPNGARLAYAPQDSNTVLFFSADGTAEPTRTMTLPGPDRVGGIAHAPDGAHLLALRCASMLSGCQGRLYQLVDPERDLEFDPQEPADQAVPGFGVNDRPQGSFDFQPQIQPIIFIHGFAGSRIACGGNELWPPTPFNETEDVLNMRLAQDGVANHPDACAAAPNGILEKAFVFGVYQSTLDFLEEIAPDHHRIFVWDWRKDPRLQLLALNTLVNDVLDDPQQQKAGVEKVVLYGHSMGGLVMRAYLNDPARAAKVSRAVTAGTPSWGSPKAIFPLASGTEMPGGTGDLDLILPDPAFRAFAQNLTGMYFLYPSEAYGSWLTVQGRSPSPLDRTGLEAYVAALGGNQPVLARALNSHRDELDGFVRNGVDVRVFVGLGKMTIGAVRLIPGGTESPSAAEITWVNGDGTVPARSAAQGPIGTADPLGANVPLSYVCGIGHVDLPGHPQVTEPITDFLLYGTPPVRTQRTNCLHEGTEVRFNNITIGGASSSGARAATTTIEDAAQQGLLQLLELPGETVAMTEKDVPVDVTVSASGARLAVTPISGDTRGTPMFYGPVTGELRLITGEGGSLTVLDDGVPVTGRPVREPGDPGAEPTTPPDTDGDGVPDASDTCVSQPGPATNNGCPLTATQPGSNPPPATGGDAQCSSAEEALAKAKKKLKKLQQKDAGKAAIAKAKKKVKKAKQAVQEAC